MRLSVPGFQVVSLAAALLLLFPPAQIDGTYSILEVALLLLVCALLPSVRSDLGIAVPTALVLLVALMGASTVWSVASWVTLRDASAYALLVLAAVLLARTLTVGQIATSVVIMGSVALGLSLVAAAVRPETAVDSSGLLRGVYGNRNGLAYVLVQTLPAVIALPLRFRFGLVARLSLAGLFFAAIVATGSKTALICAVLVVAVWLMMVVARRWVAAWWAFGALLATIAIVAVANYERVLALLGKDSTVSGRTEIWAATFPVIGEHLVLGTGWARSWPVGSPQYEAMVGAFARPFFHAHNEVLNWLVTLGVVGLVLVVAVYGFVAWSGWKAWTEAVCGSPFVLLVVVMMVSRGLTEISETSAQGWLVLALAAAVGAQHLQTGRMAVPSAVLLRWPRDSAVARLS